MGAAANFHGNPPIIRARARNGSELSAKLEFTLEKPGYKFPKYPVPSGESQITFLRAQVTKGGHERYRPITDRVRRQLTESCALLRNWILQVIS
jgi:DNA polymerase III alpha subunit